jgi:hypothetical protein
MAILTLALAAAGGCTAAAATPAALSAPPPAGTGLPAGQCIRLQDFGNHAVADERTLLVKVFGKGVYRFTMSTACLRSAISSDPIGMRSVSRETICKPGQLDISARGGICKVESIARLTPEEVATLPRGSRP